MIYSDSCLVVIQQVLLFWKSPKLA